MKPTLVFDLDGTLAHTAPDLIATLNRICSPHGLNEVELSQVGQIVGHGAKAMIEQVFKINNTSLSEDLLEKLFDEFLSDYSTNIAVETQLFEEIGTLLPIFRDRGYILSVCTNKREDMARILLSQLGVDHYFSSVTGGNTFDFKKPDRRHLQETVKMAGGDTKTCIMIGDSATDIGAAKNAGVPSIAVTFGYSDVPVAELGSTAVISHFSELNSAVEQIIQANNWDG